MSVPFWNVGCDHLGARPGPPGDRDTVGEVGVARGSGSVAGDEHPVVAGRRRGLPECGEVGGDRGDAGRGDRDDSTDEREPEASEVDRRRGDRECQVEQLASAVRELMAGDWPADEIAWTLGWSAAFVLVFGPVTMRLYNRK